MALTDQSQTLQNSFKSKTRTFITILIISYFAVQESNSSVKHTWFLLPLITYHIYLLISGQRMQTYCKRCHNKNLTWVEIILEVWQGLQFFQLPEALCFIWKQTIGIWWIAWKRSAYAMHLSQCFPIKLTLL